VSTPVSESTSKLLLDAVACPLLVFRDGHITFANLAACSALRSDQPALVGSPLERWIHPDDWTKLRGWDQPGDQTTTQTLRFLRADQQVVTAECAASPTSFEGQPAWMGTFLPPAEPAGQEDVKAALHRIRERFNILAEHMNDFIVEISTEATLLYVSPSCKRVLDFEADELRQNWSLSLVHPDDLERINQAIQAALQGKIDPYIVFRAQHRNGDYVWLEASGSVVRHESGEVRSLIAVCRDVTRRKQIEDALLASEQRYRTLAEQMNDVILELMPDGKITYVSPSCLSVLGYAPEELLDHVSFDWIPPEDRDVVTRQFMESVVDRNPYVVSFRFQHKKGYVIWLEASCTVVENAADHSLRVQAICRDFTAHKLTEDALRQAESLMRQVMELVPVDIYIYDVAEQCNIFHNRKTNLGYHLEDIAQASDAYYGQFVHPDDRAIFDDKVRRLAQAKDGEIIDSEHRMWHADGEWRWIAFHDMVFKRDADGKPTQFLGYFQDVTERRNVEAALRLSEERLRTIADNMHDMVSMVDANLIFTHASPAHRIALGYEPSDLIGHSAIEYIHPDDLELVRRSAQTAFQKRDGDMIEYRFKHADGYYVWVETSGRVMTDSAGNVTGAVFTSRDISERRWMQRALVEQERLVTALQKEQELGELMQRMMSRLSHELRTPLAVISSSTDLLEYYGQRMNETQRVERLHQIRSQIRTLTGMLDNMSLVVKGLSFSSDFSASTYDLERLCRQIIDDVPKLLKAAQTIDLRLSGPLSQVPADEHLMRLILTHLLSNALKYSPPASRVEIDVNATTEAIELKVIDHGFGILPEDRDRVFEPFFRGTNINEAPGLGIGLSIVEKAVASHHGIIELTSEPGKGTQVMVKLPLKLD
jgi:PAS domain S-box-containing protein